MKKAYLYQSQYYGLFTSLRQNKDYKILQGCLSLTARRCWKKAEKRFHRTRKKLLNEGFEVKRIFIIFKNPYSAKWRSLKKGVD